MAGIFDIEIHDGQPENSDDEDDAIDITEVIRWVNFGQNKTRQVS